MKKLAILLLSSFLLTGLFILESCQSTKTSTASKMLKFNLENGKGYDYEMTTSIDQEVMGQKIGMDMSVYYSMTVDDDNGNEKIMTSTFDRVKVNMDMGPVKIDVDTDNPIETNSDTTNEINRAMGMINKLFGSMKGKKFKMKVNAEGKIMEVTGFKEMADDMVNSMSEEMGEEEKQKMKQEFSKQFSDEGIKSQFERLFYIFPNKEVKLGDNWVKNTTITQNDMPMAYNSTYEVTEIEGDMVTLEENSIIKSGKEEVDLKGKSNGTIIVDSRSGLIVSSNQDMTMTVSTNGMSFDMKAVTRIKGKAR